VWSRCSSLYLDEAIHRRLQALARRQGRTLSELVREALRRAYGPPHADERAATLRGIEGLWRDRDDIGESIAFRIRLVSTERAKIQKDLQAGTFDGITAGAWGTVAESDVPARFGCGTCGSAPAPSCAIASW